MQTRSKIFSATVPVALPGRLFAQIAQAAAAIGQRDLAIEFIDMAYLAFSGADGHADNAGRPGHLELTLTQHHERTMGPHGA
jgi:hypothetical protein